MSGAVALLPFARALILVFDRRSGQSALRVPLRMIYGNLSESEYVSGQHKCCVVSLRGAKCRSEGVPARRRSGRLNQGLVMAVARLLIC